VQAANGVEAMEEIRRQTFDIMIIDLKMPRMDGIEVIHNVRNELKLSTPVIVLTASGVEQVELESFNAGANDFVSKPFSPQSLMARIDKLIEVNG
jgi:DNA-binding response OmpR family regulator